MVKESYDFLYGSPLTSPICVKCGSHKPCGNRDMKLFIRHVIIVSCEHCG